MIKLIKSLFSARKAVKVAKGEAKVERQNGSEAPEAKKPYLRFRALMRPAIAAVLSLIAYKVPLIADPALQGLVTDAVVAGVWIYFGLGAGSDFVRLSARRGVSAFRDVD